MQRRIFKEILLRCIRPPSGILYKSLNKVVFLRWQTNHSAFILTNQCNGSYTANRDCVRYIEFTELQICPSGSNNICKVLW